MARRCSDDGAPVARREAGRGPVRARGGANTGRGVTAHAAAACVLAAVATLWCPTQAQPPDPAKRHADMAARARARLAALHAEAAALATRERTLLNELRQLELERDARGAELAQADAELAAATADLDAARADIATLEARLAAERPGITARMVRLYQQGTTARPAAWLAASRVQDAARNHRLLAALARADRDRLAAYAAQARQLEQARARLEARTNDAAAWRARALAARTAAATAAAAHAALVARIDRERDLTARLTGELEQAHARLDASIAQLARGATAPTAVLPIRSFQGALDWPAAGSVSAGPGHRGSPRLGSGVRRTGLEIEVTEGSPVRSVHEGRVAFAEAFSGFGRLVIVEHGQGVFSLYGHLDTLAVTRGTHLQAGHLVGTSGRAPGGTPALYFELRVDGRPVNPLQWLKRQ